MASERNLKSKTVWGFGIFLLVGAFQTIGWLPDASWVVEGIQWLSALLGVNGVRDIFRDY